MVGVVAKAPANIGFPGWQDKRARLPGCGEIDTNPVCTSAQGAWPDALPNLHEMRAVHLKVAR